VDEVVWNGVPVSPQRPPLQEMPTIAYAGRLVPKKGVHVLINALSHVVKEIPSVGLVIAGDGPMRADLERQVEAAGLSARVRWLGHLSREALEREIADAWVQVAPSLWDEPFGLVAAEAMMRGTAAVVSATGGLGEQVVDGKTGFHVPPGDVVALANVLVRLLRDRRYAEEMGTAARVHALANFTEDRVIRRFEELYHRLIAGETAHSASPAASSEPQRPTPATGAA
jgi:glycosyltransferase involved in cell wall biosynthesis